MTKSGTVAGALCDKTDLGGDGELLMLLFIVQTPLLVLLLPSDWNASETKLIIYLPYCNIM